MFNILHFVSAHTVHNTDDSIPAFRHILFQVLLYIYVYVLTFFLNFFASFFFLMKIPFHDFLFLPCFHCSSPVFVCHRKPVTSHNGCITCKVYCSAYSMLHFLWYSHDTLCPVVLTFSTPMLSNSFMYTTQTCDCIIHYSGVDNHTLRSSVSHAPYPWSKFTRLHYCTCTNTHWITSLKFFSLQCIATYHYKLYVEVKCPK